MFFQAARVMCCVQHVLPSTRSDHGSYYFMWLNEWRTVSCMDGQNPVDLKPMTVEVMEYTYDVDRIMAAILILDLALFEMDTSILPARDSSACRRSARLNEAALQGCGGACVQNEMGTTSTSSWKLQIIYVPLPAYVTHSTSTCPCFSPGRLT